LRKSLWEAVAFVAGSFAVFLLAAIILATLGDVLLTK
jgi:hypothetical protein